MLPDAAGMARSSSTVTAVLAVVPRIATVQKPTDRLSSKVVAVVTEVLISSGGAAA